MKIIKTAKYIKLSKGFSPEKKRRMPEADDQLYDYFHGDDPPFQKEDYFDHNMRDIDLAKPPNEMSIQERESILHPEEGDINKSNYKIDEIVKNIIDKEGKINKVILNKHMLDFLKLNLQLKYIWNYIKKNYNI